MTSQEWADAADRGDPRTLGRDIHKAIAHAGQELGMQAEPDWDGLTHTIQNQLIRAGELLREQGWIAP